jgi:hypothetical protein
MAGPFAAGQFADPLGDTLALVAQQRCLLLLEAAERLRDVPVARMYEPDRHGLSRHPGCGGKP